MYEARSNYVKRTRIPTAILGILLVAASGVLSLGVALSAWLFSARAVAANSPVSLSITTGTFYPNPSNSGPFDATQLGNPQFSQPFPVINFNPSSTAGYCSNNTGINSSTRPVTDVFANPDGTCGTIPAQGNGQQAGVSGLFEFEAVFLSNLNVASAGQITFNIPSDDGWILGVGSQGGGQPTYVSGSLFDAPSSSPSKGYQVVGAYNSTAPSGAQQVTVSFPAAGAYPMEMDFTECCGGPEFVALTTSTAGVIPPLTAQQPLSGGPVTEPEERGQDNACLRCSLDGSAADPVNTGTGNFSESATDISLPGRGFPINFRRVYNASTAALTGPLGYGWASDVFMSLSQPGGNGPVTVTQEGGAQVVFNQNGAAYAAAAPRDIATLAHNGDGTWTFTRLAQETFAFSGNGQLTSERDLNGYTTTFTYNSSQLVSVTDAEGRSLTFGWTGNLLTSVTDANVSPNRTVSLQYNDGSGNLTDVIDVNGGHTHFAYDGLHHLTNMYDPNCYAAGVSCNSGAGVVIGYNAAGQVGAQQDQLGRTTMFAYSGDPTSSTGGTTTVTDPRGNVTVDTYQYGVLTSETKGSGTAQAATWHYTYDPATASISSTTDPNGHTTWFTVDGNGNRVSTTDPLGRQSFATYNGFNEPLTQTDPKQVTTTYTYDATSGNLMSVSTPLVGTTQNRVTTYTYSDSGHPGDVTALKDPDTKTWKYGYDAYGDRQTQTDPLGNVSTTCYNGDGWKIASYTPKAGAITCTVPPPSSPYETTYSYLQQNNQVDEFGDVQAVTDPLSHTMSTTYDADRNVVSATDGNGNLTRYIVDLGSEPTDTIRADQSDIHTDYYPDGTVRDQKDGKGDTIQTYNYDPLARVMSVTDALNNVTTYTYDPAGNRLTQQDPGGTCSGSPVSGCTTTTYDADNEPTSIVYSDGSTPNVSGVTYDADGQRTAMTDGTGSPTWVWDSLHRLTSSTDGRGDQVQYQYNLRGLVTQLTYPGGFAVLRGYDDAGRWTSVQDWLGNSTTFGYDVNGNLTTKTLPSGTSIADTTGYNAADQLTSISDMRGTSTIFAASYGRDNVGQITSDTSLPAGANADQYTSLNQLCYAGSSNGSACSSPPSGAQVYSFDGADNLINDKGTTQSFNAADELCWSLNGSSSNACGSAPAGATSFGYNTRGDRTTVTPPSGSATNLNYDQANRLTSVAQSSSTTATYAYNGDGLRVSKTTGGISSPFVWDASAATPFVISDGTYQYIYGPGGAALEQIAMLGSISLQGRSSNQGTSRTLTLIIPSGTQPNDQILIASLQPTGTTVNPPAGYSLVQSVAGGANQTHLDVFRHTFVSGDNTTFVTVSYSSNSTAKDVFLSVYRGVDPNHPIDITAAGSNANSTTVAVPSTTPPTANDRLVLFQGALGTSAAAWTPPGGMNETEDMESPLGLGCAEQSFVAGATGVRTSTYGLTASDLSSLLVALAPPHTATLVGTGSAAGKSASLTVIFPSGVQANDQVVVASTQPSSTSVTAPSGYSQVASVTSGGASPQAATTVFTHKVATGDVSVTLSYSSGSTAQAVALAVYRGLDPTLPVDVTSVGSAAAAGSVTAPSLSTGYSNDELVVFQGAVGSFSKSATWTAPTGTTERAQTSTSNASTGVSDETLGSGGATGTITSNFSSSANLATVAVAVLQPPTVLYYSADQIGSTRVLAGTGGGVRATFVYDAYGNISASTGGYVPALGFNSQYRDAETGFLYLRGRYYDPVTTQFLSRDPFVAKTRSPYAYALDNPVNFSDPQGLDVCSAYVESGLCEATLGNCTVEGQGNCLDVLAAASWELQQNLQDRASAYAACLSGTITPDEQQAFDAIINQGITEITRIETLIFAEGQNLGGGTTPVGVSGSEFTLGGAGYVACYLAGPEAAAACGLIGVGLGAITVNGQSLASVLFPSPLIDAGTCGDYNPTTQQPGTYSSGGAVFIPCAPPPSRL